jgi:ATP-dependent RNA helicase DeaD
MYLLDRGYRVDSLHGDKSQAARETTMKAFRDRKVKLLICTDVAARGLDVKDVTHVINYSIPKELDSYVHRIGRTARCGKSGFALSLISPRQRLLIAQIERLTKSKLQEGTIPTRKELGVKKVAYYLQKFQEPAGYARAVEALGDGWKELLATMTPEEVAGRFLALTFPEIFAERDPERGNGFPASGSSGFPSTGERSHAAPRPARGESRVRPVVAPVSRSEGSRAWDKVSARASRHDEQGDDKGRKGKPFKKFPAAAAGSKFAGKAKKPGKKTAWANT